MADNMLRKSISEFSYTALGEGALGVLLAGSAAIGCEHAPPDGPKYGDIDMYIGLRSEVAHRGRPDWCPVTLAERPLHVSLITEARAARAPHTLRLYEARGCGVLVAGIDIRDWFPQVTLQTLDVGDLNDIVLWRLHDLAGAWGHYLRTRDSNYLGYTACKNLLDLSTWAYPHAGLLLPSIVARLRDIPTLDASDILRQLIGRFADVGMVALQGKQGGRIAEPMELFHHAVESFLLAGTAILDRSSSLSLGSDLSDVRARRRWAARRSLVSLHPRMHQPVMNGLRFLRYPHREMLHWYVTSWNTLTGDLSVLHSTRTLMAALFGGSVEEFS